MKFNYMALCALLSISIIIVAKEKAPQELVDEQPQEVDVQELRSKKQSSTVMTDEEALKIFIETKILLDEQKVKAALNELGLGKLVEKTILVEMLTRKCTDGPSIIGLINGAFESYCERVNDQNVQMVCVQLMLEQKSLIFEALIKDYPEVIQARRRVVRLENLVLTNHFE